MIPTKKEMSRKFWKGIKVQNSLGIKLLGKHKLKMFVSNQAIWSDENRSKEIRSN